MNDVNENGTLLSVRHLTQNFRTRTGVFCAVHNVSFDIARGEAFGLVGESGSGKTTTGRAIMGINRISGGDMLFNGESIAVCEGGIASSKKRRWC